ncbi:MAG TPA: alpha/beta hydrolase [Gemmatimonadaceae bacterium]
MHTTREDGERPTIVLVHGAWADGSSWEGVIRPLQQAGYHVIAVQNPLTSFADDVATTQRVIDAQPGPVVVVAHSYGGAVITAAAGRPNVRALVYIAGFAPDAREPFQALLSRFGDSDVIAALVPDAAGALYIDTTKFHEVFCADLPAEQANVLAATQKPLAGSIFGASIDTPAWKTIPSWYLVTQEDRVIKPELQRFMTQRMGARASEIRSSHVAYISHPTEVARLVEEVAGGVMETAAT